MKFAQAQQGLLNATKALVGLTQTNLVLVETDTKQISWRNRKSGIIQRVYYPIEYQQLVDSHQYSLLLSDGSFFQFFYDFGANDELIKARLAFYPAPEPTTDALASMVEAADSAAQQEDEALWEHLHNWIDLLDDGKSILSNTSHIRFDYDRLAHGHAPAHIQLGSIQEFRLEACYFPLPLAFIELVANLLKTFDPLDSQALNHARNNPLELAALPQIIALRN